MRTKRFIAAVISSLALAWNAATVTAQPRYYVTVLAYQSELNRPKLAHTFAVFTKASGAGTDAKLHNHTISWLPATLNVKWLRRRPEPGKNLDLAATLKLARAHNLQIAVWGPFPIEKKLYVLALKRIKDLQSGKYQYIAMDRRYRDDKAFNCIHALSDLDPKQRDLDTGIAYGDLASALVVKHLERWFVKSDEDTAWLRERLGLKGTELKN